MMRKSAIFTIVVSALSLTGTLTGYGESNVASKFAPSDSVQFVSTNGNDSNDGLSPGTAKSTIAGALSALPSCTINHQITISGSYTSYKYSHCGTIHVASGTFTVPSQITITSPFVKIQGSDQGSTVIAPSSALKGCAISWTASPFSEEFTGSGGLYDVRIDGYNAPAGTCGLLTSGISAFHARSVSIWNFVGPGSIGWHDSSTSAGYNEKFDVEMTLKNNTVGWQMDGSTSCCWTFGFGFFDAKIETLSGQTGVLFDGANSNGRDAGDFSQSIIHLTINQVSDPTSATAIMLKNGARWHSNVSDIHIESPAPVHGIGTGSELNICSTCAFSGAGFLDQDLPGTNIIKGELGFGGGGNHFEGKVGIGTSSPRDNLDLLGPNATLDIDNDAGNAGTVGIKLLHVAGASNQQKVAIMSDSIGMWGMGNLRFAVNTNMNLSNAGLSDTKLYIDARSGDVGVGTTSPQATLDTAGQDRRMPVTFSTLPVCSSTIEGETAAVTDSTTNSWGTRIAGSGTKHVLAYCDSSNWTVAGN